jgi:hypothetical protein
VSSPSMALMSYRVPGAAGRTHSRITHPTSTPRGDLDFDLESLPILDPQ